MDELEIGRAVRRLRHRLGWRQSDVAERAGVSASTVSLIERGARNVTLGTLRRVGRPLELRIDIVLRWRGGELFHLLAAGHARMAEEVARRLEAAGWEVRPEVSFSHFGERGVVDLVAWNAACRAILLIELKTELVDIGDLLSTMDRRRRLASVIGAAFGWEPDVIGSWVVLTDSRTNRRRLADHATVLRAAFPMDGRSVAGWLLDPSTPAAALWFLPFDDEGRFGPRPGPRRRVHVRTPPTTRR
jgi:transcriptional regulator with XRE-family HTH domain